MSGATGTIIAALIGLCGSGIGAGVGVIVSAKMTQYRLEQLEKKVQAHNNLVERMYKVEGRTDLQEEEIRTANRRLDKLEREGHI